MQLTHNDTLRAIDDKRAGIGHQGHFTQIDLLLLNLSHWCGLAIDRLVPHDETHHDAQGISVGDALLTAFGHLVLGPVHERALAVFVHHARAAKSLVLTLFGFPHANFVADILQRCGAIEVMNGKDTSKHRFQAPIFTIERRAVLLQKTGVGLLLHLD